MAESAFLALREQERADVGVLKTHVLALAASQPNPPPEQRRRLLRALLEVPPESLDALPHTAKLAFAAVVKLLGRVQAGSEPLAKERSLALLLHLSGLARLARSSHASYKTRTGSPTPPQTANGHVASTSTAGTSSTDNAGNPSTSTGAGAAAMATEDEQRERNERASDDPLALAESEALRCVCNTLMLHPSARELIPSLLLPPSAASTSSSTSTGVSTSAASFQAAVPSDERALWLDGLCALLPKRKSGFLAGRLLFLATSTNSSLIKLLVRRRDVIHSIAAFFAEVVDMLAAAQHQAASNAQGRRDPLDASGQSPTTADVLNEYLKTVYNLMLQWGRAAQVDVDSVADEIIARDYTPDLGLGLSVPPSALNTVTSTSGSGHPQHHHALQQQTTHATNSSVDDMSAEGHGSTDDSTEASSPAPRTLKKRPPRPSTAQGQSTQSLGQQQQRYLSSQSEGSDAVGAAMEQSNSRSPKLLTKRIMAAVSTTFGGAGSTSPPSPSASPRIGDESDPLAEAAATPSPLPFALPATLPTTLRDVAPFVPLFAPLVALALALPSPGPLTAPPSSVPVDDAKEPPRTLRHVIEALLNFPAAMSDLAYDGTDVETTAFGWRHRGRGAHCLDVRSAELDDEPSDEPLARRLLRLLECMLMVGWFPVKRDKEGEIVSPDDMIPRGIGDAAKAEEAISPLMLVLAKLASLPGPARVIKNKLLPDNIDRSIPLEQREDLTGVMLRLMCSILVPNTAHAAGELLFELCGRDPERFVRSIGYGNAAGFLQNIGQLIPPPPEEESAEGGAAQPRVDPITGAHERRDHAAREASELLASMSEEDKEREAERLYVLFERLRKTRVVDIQNPVRTAQDEGRFQEIDDKVENEERERREAEDERDEQEALEELRRYRERKTRQ